MDVYYPHINEDGSIVFYHAVVNINCSNENKYSYSKDGKLHNRTTDMMDNRLFYGDFEIIGNLPIRDKEDYPIMYGGSISALYRAVHLQCGKLHLRDDNGTALYHDFTNQGIGFGLNFQLPILQECIEACSNTPYWNQNHRKVLGDLRNPKFRTELEQVCKQFGILPSMLIK